MEATNQAPSEVNEKPTSPVKSPKKSPVKKASTSSPVKSPVKNQTKHKDDEESYTTEDTVAKDSSEEAKTSATDAESSTNNNDSVLASYQKGFYKIYFRKDTTQHPKVFIRRLDYSITEEQMKEYFTKFGTVKDSMLLKDKSNGKSTGTGLVTFTDIEALNNVFAEPCHTINNSTFMVCPSAPSVNLPAIRAMKNTYGTSTVFLGGLSPDMTELDIKTEMSIFGVINEIKVMKKNDESIRGFGFVIYENSEQAVRALAAESRHICGRVVKINMVRNSNGVNIAQNVMNSQAQSLFQNNTSNRGGRQNNRNVGNIPNGPNSQMMLGGQFNNNQNNNNIPFNNANFQPNQMGNNMPPQQFNSNGMPNNQFNNNNNGGNFQVPFNNQFNNQVAPQGYNMNQNGPPLPIVNFNNNNPGGQFYNQNQNNQFNRNMNNNNNNANNGFQPNGPQGNNMYGNQPFQINLQGQNMNNNNNNQQQFRPFNDNNGNNNFNIPNAPYTVYTNNPNNGQFPNNNSNTNTTNNNAGGDKQQRDYAQRGYGPVRNTPANNRAAPYSNQRK